VETDQTSTSGNGCRAPIRQAQPKPTPKEPDDGLVTVYTGDGKGKTCAALGMVFRALGRGLDVAVVVFERPDWPTGECLFAQALPQLSYLVAHDLMRSPPVSPQTADRLAFGDAWLRAAACMASGTHRLIVLDNIFAALNAGHLRAADVVAALRARPPHVHVVCTGAQAPPALLAVADVVTEMVRHRHAFAREQVVQVGVDF
jgi:cob(I)alamin adenosyltransferase